MHEKQDFIQLINSRAAIVVIESRDEKRILEFLRVVSSQLQLRLLKWSITDGLSNCSGTSTGQGNLGPEEMLRHMWNLKYPGVYALLDFHPYLSEPLHIRLLREIAQASHRYRQTIVLLSHKLNLPDELKHLSARFEFSLPDDSQLLQFITQTAKGWSQRNGGQKISADREAIALLAKNLRGLSLSEAERLILKAFQDKAITHEDIPEVAKAKYELLNKDGVLFYEHDTARLSDVGGLRRLKNWLQRRRAVFLGEHSMKNIDLPRGILLLGVQGSGKSLAAKAVAGAWGVPLLRLDFGALFDKYYGETERKLRDSLKLADKMAPCVLWLDEIEKGVATDTSDGGTSKRVLGTLLTWMAERKSAVFIVATANDIQSLPPELLRKGRIDEIFFVDLPTQKTRAEIFAIHLRKRGLDLHGFDLKALAAASKGFSGAEIEQGIVSALYSMVGESGQLTSELLLNEIAATRPLSVVMAEQIVAMRAWAAERTVQAD